MVEVGTENTTSSFSSCCADRHVDHADLHQQRSRRSWITNAGLGIRYGRIAPVLRGSTRSTNPKRRNTPRRETKSDLIFSRIISSCLHGDFDEPTRRRLRGRVRKLRSLPSTCLMLPGETIVRLYRGPKSPSLPQHKKLGNVRPGSFTSIVAYPRNVCLSLDSDRKSNDHGSVQMPPSGRAFPLCPAG